jgi:hypothetical protein
VPSTIDWEAIRKANRKSRTAAAGGRKTLALLREKAKTSPDYAVIANPGMGTFHKQIQSLSFQRRTALD